MSKFGQAELDLEDKEELFDLVFRMIYYRGVNTAPKPNTFAGHVKNDEANVEKIPSTASRKRNAAKLRNVRWNIYQKIKSRKLDVSKTLGYYKFLVKKFLQRFSAKLKQKELVIWQQKLARTSKDVEEFLTKLKSHPTGKNKDVLAVKEVENLVACERCSLKNNVVSLDTAVVIMSTLLKLVNVDQGNLKKEESKVSYRTHQEER